MDDKKKMHEEKMAKARSKLTPEQLSAQGAKGGSAKNPNKGFGSNRAKAVMAGRLSGHVRRMKKRGQRGV